MAYIYIYISLFANRIVYAYVGTFHRPTAYLRTPIRNDVILERNILCASTQVEIDCGLSMQKINGTGRLLTPQQEEFYNSLDIKIYGCAFIDRLRDLQEYKNKYGNCSVPKRYADNAKLGEQRAYY